jgi:hypothetical protein
MNDQVLRQLIREQCGGMDVNHYTTCMQEVYESLQDTAGRNLQRLRAGTTTAGGGGGTTAGGGGEGGGGGGETASVYPVAAAEQAQAEAQAAAYAAAAQAQAQAQAQAAAAAAAASKRGGSGVSIQKIARGFKRSVDNLSRGYKQVRKATGYERPEGATADRSGPPKTSIAITSLNIENPYIDINNRLVEAKDKKKELESAKRQQSDVVEILVREYGQVSSVPALKHTKDSLRYNLEQEEASLRSLCVEYLKAEAKVRYIEDVKAELEEIKKLQLDKQNRHYLIEMMLPALATRHEIVGLCTDDDDSAACRASSGSRKNRSSRSRSRSRSRGRKSACPTYTTGLPRKDIDKAVSWYTNQRNTQRILLQAKQKHNKTSGTVSGGGKIKIKTSDVYKAAKEIWDQIEKGKVDAKAFGPKLLAMNTAVRNELKKPLGLQQWQTEVYGYFVKVLGAENSYSDYEDVSNAKPLSGSEAKDEFLERVRRVLEKHITASASNFLWLYPIGALVNTVVYKNPTLEVPGTRKSLANFYRNGAQESKDLFSQIGNKVTSFFDFAEQLADKLAGTTVRAANTETDTTVVMSGILLKLILAVSIPRATSREPRNQDTAKTENLTKVLDNALANYTLKYKQTVQMLDTMDFDAEGLTKTLKGLLTETRKYLSTIYDQDNVSRVWNMAAALKYFSPVPAMVFLEAGLCGMSLPATAQDHNRFLRSDAQKVAEKCKSHCATVANAFVDLKNGQDVEMNLQVLINSYLYVPNLSKETWNRMRGMRADRASPPVHYLTGDYQSFPAQEMVMTDYALSRIINRQPGGALRSLDSEAADLFVLNRIRHVIPLRYDWSFVKDAAQAAARRRQRQQQ